MDAAPSRLASRRDAPPVAAQATLLDAQGTIDALVHRRDDEGIFPQLICERDRLVVVGE